MSIISVFLRATVPTQIIHGAPDGTVRIVEWMNVRLPDRRVLDVLAGEWSGAGLLFHHGTPGNATRYQKWFASVEERGLRPVAYSRPGYATSTRHQGRTVASAVADSVFLLDQLGIGEFYSLGGSGGGPHTIACAAMNAALVTDAFEGWSGRHRRGRVP